MLYRFLPLTLAALSVYAQPQPELVTFEVASVRLTPQANWGYTTFGPYGENRYTVSNAALGFLVQVAYGVPYEQILGIEKLGSEHYDVAAKAEDGVLLTGDQLQPRMRRLLEERFKLVTHTEMKEYDGYALVAAKGGPRLKPTAGGSESGGIYPGGLRLIDMPLNSFAGLLRSPAGRPVVDKTSQGITTSRSVMRARATRTPRSRRSSPRYRRHSGSNWSRRRSH